MPHDSAPSAAASATAVVSEPPRPSVVMSRSVETPWKPATRTIRFWSSASWIRCARTSTIFALPWNVSVTIPACEPVSEIASCPRSWIAIAASAHEMRSPTEISMSSSRGFGRAETSYASRTSSSVVSPMAERTATTRVPSVWDATMRAATFLRRSGSATDVPPRGRPVDEQFHVRDAFGTSRGTVPTNCRAQPTRVQPRPQRVQALAMRYRQLGSSDLQISEISLGSWLTYGLGVDDSAARACVHRAFGVGINFIDTSNVYGRGAAETFLGDVLQDRPRDSYVLATKLHFPMDETGENQGLARQQVFKQIDDSLRRLRTDHVDLYQCHRYDPKTPLEETMEALSEVVRQGKARYLGFSEWTADQIQASLDLSPPNEKFVSSQPQYSILWRVPERDVIPLCEANGISQIVWSPLGQGVLTGKYGPGEPPPADSRMSSERMGWAMDRFRSDDVLEAVQRLRPIADGLGVTMAQLAIAWVLREPNVASAIVGASRPEQVDDNAAASGVDLRDETLAAIDEAVGDVVWTDAVAA